MAWQDASSATSSARAVAAEPMACAVSSTPGALRSPMITLAPSAASRFATARPIPEAAPVTIAVLPSSRMLPLLTCYFVG